MKKLISLLLVLVVVLGCVSLIACGEEKGGTTPSPSEGEAALSPEEGEGEAPLSGGGFTWDDMPVYPGADTDESLHATISQEDLKLGKRLYETGDSLEKVADFYKSEMPKNGWHEEMWMSLGEGVQGSYSKNNGQDFAIVAIADRGEERGTFISFSRGHYLNAPG